jgi:5'-deoxynucleotidase YfbR-like HD superfamily hydrolase
LEVSLKERFVIAWMMTYSGVHFPIIDPGTEHIKLRDIAHALSLINRYGGHTKYRYSVGLHCLLGAEQMKKDGHNDLTILYFLLHDAPEAYYGDIPRPLKVVLGDLYTQLEDNVMRVIWKALGLREPTELEWDIVRYYDNLVLGYEIAQIMPYPDEFEVDVYYDQKIAISKEKEEVIEATYMLALETLLDNVQAEQVEGVIT